METHTGEPHRASSEVLQVAPSTYYSARSRPPCARAVRDRELTPALRAIWERNYSGYVRRKLALAAGEPISMSAVTKWPG